MDEDDADASGQVCDMYCTEDRSQESARRRKDGEECEEKGKIKRGC